MSSDLLLSDRERAIRFSSDQIDPNVLKRRRLEAFQAAAAPRTLLPSVSSASQLAGAVKALDVSGADPSSTPPAAKPVPMDSVEHVRRSWACDKCQRCLEFTHGSAASGCGVCGCPLIDHIRDGDESPVDIDDDAEEWQDADSDSGADGDVSVRAHADEDADGDEFDDEDDYDDG
eukprot:TRINITY_DN15256_c0_g1_i1.p1 TRINITY_DN15256_c0_g1~~TRINITY_DN15256_c0_g1_i1.p1  ORF type:complete len:175 (+),score=42.82 TRINITY_DN15256_c0_g1_i1:84-608(+)